MSSLLIVSIVSITSALLFYSIGVWSERISGRLKLWHLIFFYVGLLFDTTGTTLMSDMAGRLQFNLHGITGAIAIILMLFHAVWGTIVLIRKQETLIRNFHKFSLFVWLVWLVPFFTGMTAAMLR